MSTDAAIVVLPRFLRLKDAPKYLGMDRNRFCQEVRPFITEIRMGTRSVAFDRLELDAFADQYRKRNGRPTSHKENLKWDAKQQCLVSR